MNEYIVTINGLPHTMQLSKEDADRLGAVAVKKAAPANKARTTTATKAGA